MKRRQRRPVLDINNEQSESTRGRWQNKYQQIAVDHPEQNGNNTTTQDNNPLASLLGQYNSDSENEDNIKHESSNSNKLNDKVNDFLKEIQMIAPDSVKSNDTEKSSETLGSSGDQSETPNCSWQECFDETTGYPYYWHIETNEVTWDIPNEIKILRDKSSSENNKNHSQLQTLHSHSQVQQQQWANFLPNTYPELQTNIPEGMIPKEVVARNRNRQVGLSKSRQSSATDAQTAKKGGPKDEDSDDEKIEMITSFGNDESESETSDSESPGKKDPPLIPRVQKSGASLSSDKNLCLKDGETVSIGPLLPPGIIPMIHGPENASLEMRNEMEFQKTDKNRENLTTGIKEVEKTEDINEEDILKRLKNQAKLLQSLGGEVPESVETLIKKNDELDEAAEDEDDDIISQIEKEMPVDYPVAIDLQKENETVIKIVEGVEKTDKTKSKEFKISLVAGYSDDSDPEEELSPKKIIPQPLFPISEYIVKENKQSVKVLPGDLSRAKELIGTELSSAGELETNKNEDDNEISKNNVLKEDSLGNENHSQSSINGNDSAEIDENKIARTENETARQHSFFENLEIPNKAFKRKKRIAFDVIPNKTARPQSDSVNTNSSKSESQNYNYSGLSSNDDVERLGFGFRKENQSEVDNKSDYGEEEITDKQKFGDSKENSSSLQQLKKPIINFVKGETTSGLDKSDDNNEKQQKKNLEFQKPDPDNEDTKKLKDLSDIVMEKIKFLSEGSQNLSAIQIMVIQLQTLLGAWESGDLRENFLYEWLKGTELELGRLEKAAAPPGWDCHWDRSHKRYYYRNSITGDAQWTYPEADVVGGTEEMDLCTTPPPPEDEELQIIEEQGRNGLTEKGKDEIKSALPTIGDDNKIVEITKDEYKSLEAPPPPKISSPSPPPPPRIFAEDLKKGKKRRGSISDRISDPKKEKTGADFQEEQKFDPPLPPSPPKNQSPPPPLPPNPPHASILPNPPNNEPLPPGVDPKDMPYSLPTAVTNLETGIIYSGTTQQNNPIYAATIGDRTAISVPIIDHRSGIIQGQLMHYPTYQHLHNQAMIAAAAGTLGGQEAVQFMLTDYSTQVYANTQVIAKPPVKKTPNNQSLGSALDSFYNDIASIEKTNAAEQESSTSQEFEPTNNLQESNTPPPTISTLPPPHPPPPATTICAAPNNSTIDIENKVNASIPDPAAGREKKRKKAKVGIGKKQKEMSTMVAKWQKAQQDFDESE